VRGDFPAGPEFWAEVDESDQRAVAPGDLVSPVIFRAVNLEIAWGPEDIDSDKTQIVIAETDRFLECEIPATLGRGLVLCRALTGLLIAPLVAEGEHEDEVPAQFVTRAASVAGVPGWATVPPFPWEDSPRMVACLRQSELFPNQLILEMRLNVSARLTELGRDQFRAHLEAVSLECL